MSLGEAEQVADARSANANEHLDEFRRADAEEWHARFPGQRPGNQGLTRTGRANQQDALRNASANRAKLLRIFEEVDDLRKLQLRLFDAGHVVESDRSVSRTVESGPALPE